MKNYVFPFTLSVLALTLFGAFSVPYTEAVTVGPVKLEYATDPGKTIKGEFFLQNEGDVTQTLYPSFERFTENSSGGKNFTKEKSDLSTWFSMPESVTLKSQIGKQIPFTINVPKDAPPGGHFAVIWWSSAPPGESGEQVAIVTRAGILVYLTVSGDVKEEGMIEDFSPRTRFFTSFPLDFSLIFKNSGNTYLKPQGTFQIKNLFGGVSAEKQLNEFGSNVFPGTTKDLATSINPDGFFFGIYRAVVEASYGADGSQHADESTWFVIAPWGTLIGFIVLLFLVFFAIPKGLKRYNRWIIAKARER
jgi:hypothetical protein